MAKISFETMVSNPPENNGGNGGANIGFFALKNDGDVATVRILHDSINDFDIMTCHNVKLNNKFRKVACLRDPREPVENCPLCSQNNQVQQRIFIHMIEYVKTADNQVIAKPVVWERSAYQYGNKLKTMIEEYGPLSECIFRIKRNGAAGDMQTDYEMMFGNPSIYPESIYRKDPAIIETFKNYSALGVIVLDKDYNEIKEYIATGNFPAKVANAQPNTQAGTVAPAPQGYTPAQATMPPVDAPVSNEVPNTYNTTPNTNAQPARMPWEAPGTNTAGIYGSERPVRNRTY